MNAPAASTLTLSPTPDPKVFRAPSGALLSPPAGWACLPPGDAGLTRRVKAAGPSWLVTEKRGRKVFSKGLWAPAEHIEAARAALDAERNTPSYARRRQADEQRRARTQEEFVQEFTAEVLAFLRFSSEHGSLAQRMAARVAAHATPVGSGTVARTARLTTDRKAEAAVIAWMRHQTTAYDRLSIPRIKGRRREVRRELAEISRALLDLHRAPGVHARATCPLCAACAAPATV